MPLGNLTAIAMVNQEDTARLDKWLWAARFFKTRRAAVEAINGGRVTVCGAKVKASKTIGPGDNVVVRKGPYQYHVIVEEISTHRVGAAAAQDLYTEATESKTERDKVALQLRLNASQSGHTRGRPTKRDRRLLQRLRRDD